MEMVDAVTDANMDTSVVADSCNTFITTGFSLHDLPVIKERVREAVKLHAQDTSWNSFPTNFNCSHCGSEHALNSSEVKKALFDFPGRTDFVATYNEYMAMLDKVPVASIGKDYTNGISDGSNVDIVEMINPAEEEEEKTKGKKKSKTEAETETETEKSE
jgi:hypothetical protein